MVLNRAFGQPEHLADLAIAETACHQADDATLALGEGLCRFVVKPGHGTPFDVAKQRLGD
jgi:hypothetical protein